MYSDKGFEFLASGVGKLIRLHPKTENCINFEEAQLFIEADLTKELPKSYTFMGEEEGEMDTTVTYSYPWLPPRCRVCNKWGHAKETCTLMPKETTAANTDVANQVPAKHTEIPAVIVTETVVETNNKEEDRNVGSEWQTPSKSTRTPERKTSDGSPTLSILSNSYAALSDHKEEEDEEESDVVKETQEGREEEGIEDEGHKVEDGEEQSRSGDTGMEAENTDYVIQTGKTSRKKKKKGGVEESIRPSLPRESKNVHKYVTNPAAKSSRANTHDVSSNRIPPPVIIYVEFLLECARL